MKLCMGIITQKTTTPVSLFNFVISNLLNYYAHSLQWSLILSYFFKKCSSSGNSGCKVRNEIIRTENNQYWSKPFSLKFVSPPPFLRCTVSFYRGRFFIGFHPSAEIFEKLPSKIRVSSNPYSDVACIRTWLGVFLSMHLSVCPKYNI
jgi:hypothetical protein